MKNWKRNAVLATVMLFVCAGVYLNWSYNQRQDTALLTDTLNEEQVLGEDTLVFSDTNVDAQAVAETDLSETTDYFSQVRLSRQEERDNAVELLEETIAYDEGTEVGDTASETLNAIVNTALDEAEIESLVVAKGYADCVAYISDDTISIAVAAPEEGLNESDVACISDIVTGQTDYTLSQLRIVEVAS